MKSHGRGLSGGGPEYLNQLSGIGPRVDTPFHSKPQLCVSHAEESKGITMIFRANPSCEW